MDMLNFIDNGDDEVGILIRDSSYVIKNHPAFSITVGDSYASNSYPHPKAFVNDSVTYPFPYEIFVMWKFKDLLGFLAPGYPYRFIRPFAGFLNLNTTPTCLEPLPWYGHFGAVYYLSEKIEIHGKRLYKLKYISMDWQSAPCNTNFGLDKDLYLDLWYWEDVGYTYARICVEGELHTLELTHIEGCPLDEYVRTCKNSMCKYYGE
jgi:hypothetical protein